MTNYFPNQNAYLLDNDNVVLTHDLENYVKHFVKDLVGYNHAEFVKIVVDNFYINVYYILNADCGDCEENGVDTDCTHEAYEMIGYKVIDVYGGAS